MVSGSAPLSPSPLARMVVGIHSPSQLAIQLLLVEDTVILHKFPPARLAPTHYSRHILLKLEVPVRQ